MAVGVGGVVVTEEGDVGPAQVVDAVEKPVGFKAELRDGEVSESGQKGFLLEGAGLVVDWRSFGGGEGSYGGDGE